MTLRHAQAERTRTARFDPASQHRRSMIAKIHVAKRDLAMDEDDYRQILFDETSHDSLTQCSESELEKVIGRLKALGFRPVPKGGPKKGTAQHPMARKARAMWISLYQLGAVHNPSEQALETFARRQLGCERLIWARQSDAAKLIEALKSMAVRAGWIQHDRMTGKRLSPAALQSGLCHAILAKLKEAGAVPAEWELHDAMWRLCGIENAHDRGWTAEDYARLADALGRKLRATKGGAA